jgi:hypothetical protein
MEERLGSKQMQMGRQTSKSKMKVPTLPSPDEIRAVISSFLSDMRDAIASRWPEIEPELVLLHWLCERHKVNVPQVQYMKEPLNSKTPRVRSSSWVSAMNQSSITTTAPMRSSRRSPGGKAPMPASEPALPSVQTRDAPRDGYPPATRPADPVTLTPQNLKETPASKRKVLEPNWGLKTRDQIMRQVHEDNVAH